jgi:hypothetical protein
VLRKLQIPIKDIAAVYKDESMEALIKAFVNKLDALDTEITALTELRRIVDDFLQKMRVSGIKKISAMTLLYEETEKRLAPAGGDGQVNAAGMEKPVTFERLSGISLEADGRANYPAARDADADFPSENRGADRT